MPPLAVWFRSKAAGYNTIFGGRKFPLVSLSKFAWLIKELAKRGLFFVDRGAFAIV